VERGDGGVAGERGCSLDDPESGAGIGEATKAPKLGMKNWKRVEEMRYRNPFRVPGDRPKDAS